MLVSLNRKAGTPSGIYHKGNLIQAFVTQVIQKLRSQTWKGEVTQSLVAGGHSWKSGRGGVTRAQGQGQRWACVEQMQLLLLEMPTQGRKGERGEMPWPLPSSHLPLSHKFLLLSKPPSSPLTRGLESQESALGIQSRGQEDE